MQPLCQSWPGSRFTLTTNISSLRPNLNFMSSDPVVSQPLFSLTHSQPANATNANVGTLSPAIQKSGVPDLRSACCRNVQEQAYPVSKACHPTSLSIWSLISSRMTIALIGRGKALELVDPLHGTIWLSLPTSPAKLLTRHTFGKGKPCQSGNRRHPCIYRIACKVANGVCGCPAVCLFSQ